MSSAAAVREEMRRKAHELAVADAGAHADAAASIRADLQRRAHEELTQASGSGAASAAAAAAAASAAATDYAPATGYDAASIRADMQRRAREHAHGFQPTSEMEGAALKIQAAERGRQCRAKSRARAAAAADSAQGFDAQLAAFRSTAASRTGAHRAEFASHSSPLGRPRSMPEPEPQPQPSPARQGTPGSRATESSAHSSSEDTSTDTWVTLDRLWQSSSPMPSPVRPESSAGGMSLPSPGFSPSMHAAWAGREEAAAALGSEPSDASTRGGSLPFKLDAPEPQPEPEPEPEAEAAGGGAGPGAPPVPAPRPKMSDSASMLLALARVRQLSSSSGLVGERNPLGVVWHTRAPDDSFTVPKGMGRPAGPEFYTQQGQSGWHHTRQAHRELPPWIAAAASHTERHEAAASRARRKKARRLQRQRSAASKLRYR